HLDADAPRTFVFRTDQDDFISRELPPFISEQLPVADRVKRKEVYPRKWGEFMMPGRISAGSSYLEISVPQEDGLWLKSLELMPLPRR
ncbi:MAG: hypothetical protein AAFZ52_08775, partial [Bacteroidota bacterium]